MAISFNPIAFEPSLHADGPVRVAGFIIGRALQSAVRCPSCGVAYNLLVPAATSSSETESYVRHLRAILSRSCGGHPPVVQS